MPPTTSATDDGDTWIDDKPGVSAATVTVATAVRLAAEVPAPVPAAATVIVAIPGATAVTTPALVTVAMLAADEVYVYATATAAFARFTVGTIVTDWPTAMLDAVGDSASPLIAGAGAATATDAAVT